MKTTKLIKWILINMALVMFTACGGGSSGDTPQDRAIDKLIAYADANGVSEVPTLQDYLDAGVIGVTEDKLEDINQVVANLTAPEVDTTEEVQALADALGVSVPEDTVATSTPVPTPTPTPTTTSTSTPTPTPTPTDTTSPIFTSSVAASVNENQTSAITLVATDASTVTYSMSGTDAGSLSVDSSTGVVTFNTAPDFETKDAYTFTATATDTGSNTTDQTVTITILDVDENEDIVHNGTIYGTVTSLDTGKIWLDRNLGATQVCISSDDRDCYGDYYQWSRNFDGHEKSNSGITSTKSVTLDPGHGAFIVQTFSPFDWLRGIALSERVEVWSVVDGSSVCPTGFRVPTALEMEAENITDSVDAFNKLKLPLAGRRNPYSGFNGVLVLKGTEGFYWTSIFGATGSMALNVSTAGSSTAEISRGSGNSVRCIKD